MRSRLRRPLAHCPARPGQVGARPHAPAARLCSLLGCLCGAWACLCAASACAGRQGTAAAHPAHPAGRSAGRRDPFRPAALMAEVNWLSAPARAGRGSFQPGAVVAAEHLAREFRAIGLVVIRQNIPGGVQNIIGLLPGDDRAVLVSAHYDHLGINARGVMYPGADDNASGVAVMMAMARAAARAPVRLRHTVLFIAFGAEEAGLVGSGAYIRNPVWPLGRTVGIINFDMVGRNFLELVADRRRTVGVVGLAVDAGARRAAERAAARVGLHLVETPARAVEVFGFQDRTDDWWFRRRGVLAICFSTSMHRDYHEPTDTPDKIVPAQMSRIARTAYGLLRYLAMRGE